MPGTVTQYLYTVEAGAATAPPAGSLHQSSASPDKLYFSETDEDGNDRAGMLSALVPGDSIQILGTRWLVQAVDISPTGYVILTVSPATVAAGATSGTIQTVIFNGSLITTYCMTPCPVALSLPFPIPPDPYSPPP